MSGRVNFYYEIIGGHKEVTGSHIYVRVTFPDKRRVTFMVDMGLYEELEYEKLNSKIEFDVSNIDFCLLTHIHVDHCGRFPLIVKNGYKGPIYTSYQSKRLAKTALEDSCKVLNLIQQKKGEKNLYSHSDVNHTMDQMVGLNYYETYELTEGISVTLLKNGHCLGATMFFIQLSYPGESTINILFTGDYKKENIFFDVPDIPSWIVNLPKDVVCESTYGDTDSSEIEYTYETNIMNCMKRNGIAVLTSFAFQRFQEILYKLKVMQNDGRLSKSIPIYLAGSLGLTYTMIFRDPEMGIKSEMLDFLPKNYNIIGPQEIETIKRDRKRKIIVTTSGMGNYGPAQAFIPEFLPVKNALIHFPGYVAEHTVGRLIKDTEQGRKVSTSTFSVVKMADVEYTNEMSGHAKADEIISFIQSLGKVKNVFLNHGEKEVLPKFQKRILKEIKLKDCQILLPSIKYRNSYYGIEKTVHLSNDSKKVS